MTCNEIVHIVKTSVTSELSGALFCSFGRCGLFTFLSLGPQLLRLRDAPLCIAAACVCVRVCALPISISKGLPTTMHFINSCAKFLRSPPNTSSSNCRAKQSPEVQNVAGGLVEQDGRGVECCLGRFIVNTAARLISLATFPGSSMQP